MSTLVNLVVYLKKLPVLGSFINRFLTNLVCNSTRPRPRPFSLWSHIPKPMSDLEQGPANDYVSWPMLTDRQYSARHLPPG